jgi:hypothetical protein
MPGVDFDRIRRETTMEQVLNLLRFEPTRRRGEQWYGRCPLPGCESRPRSFSVNVQLRRYYCHHCHSKGNHLELWAAARQLRLNPAGIDLCQALGRDVPWIRRW